MQKALLENLTGTLTNAGGMVFLPHAFARKTLLVCMLISSSILAACGGDSSSTTTSANSSVSAAASANIAAQVTATTAVISAIHKIGFTQRDGGDTIVATPAVTPAAPAAATPAPSPVTTTVVVTPASLQLSASTYTTDENAGWLTIPVDRVGGSSGAVSVSYSTINGTATSGATYGAVSGTISWAAGDTTAKLITIPILDQQLTAGSKTFSVKLSTPTAGATLGAPATATVTVMDNDLQQADYCHPNAAGSDPTATYCTTPNFPTYGTTTLPLPANPNAQVGDGLQLASSATSLFSLVMGTATPGANMTTGQAVRGTFYLNYIMGNLTQTLGSPVDTGQPNNSTFAAVARHYDVGDPSDVHLMAADGLHLRAICSQNHTDCTPGHVYAGMIRVPAEIRPGMTVKVRYKSPAGNNSWAPIWMFSGSELSPGPGGNPYQGYGTNSSLLRLPTGNAFEIDLNDNFPQWDSTPSVPTGEQLDFGTPSKYGVKWNVAPHYEYVASGSGYSFHTGTAPFEQLPVNWSTGFHDLVLSWESDNVLNEFVDGKLVVSSYMEYPASTYVDALLGGGSKTLAMNLMIGNQAIPSFAPGGTTATENDGVSDGWTIVIQEISVWNGNIATPNTYQAASNGCNTSSC